MSEFIHHQEEPHSPGRRRFLTRTVPGALLTASSPLALAACTEVKKIQPTPETITESVPTIEAFTPTPESIGSTLIFGDVWIKLGPDSMPISYTRHFDNALPEKVIFDKNALHALQEQAIAATKTQLFQSIQINSKPELLKKDFTSEHPHVTQLPPDVIDEKEAMARGVTILQGQATSLHIRQAAFGTGGPLEAFNGTGRRLRIALVDGPVIHSSFMKDTQYTTRDVEVVKQGERSLGIDTLTPDEMRANLISDSEEFGEKILWQARNNTSLLSQMDKIYLRNLSFINFIRTAPQETIIYRYLSEHGKGAVGLYQDHHPLNEATILLAAGTLPQENTSIVIGFGSTGDPIIAQGFNLQLSQDNVPFATQSYPNHTDFTINPSASPDNPNSYRYGGQSLGLVLLHELTHDKFIGQAYQKGNKANDSEYDTDMEAMKILTAGSEKWIQSGFTDDTGYYFAFSVPQERGGGYIITQKLEPGQYRPL